MSVITSERNAALRRLEVQQRNENFTRLFWRALFLILLVICTAIFMAPFLWLVSASLKERADVFNSDLIPDPFAWVNYVNVWQKTDIPIWLGNSVMVALLAATSVTISCAAVAFG